MILLKIVEREQKAGEYGDSYAVVTTQSIEIVAEDDNVHKLHTLAINHQRLENGKAKFLLLSGQILNLKLEDWEEKKNWIVSVPTGNHLGQWEEIEENGLTHSEVHKKYEGQIDVIITEESQKLNNKMSVHTEESQKLIRCLVMDNPSSKLKAAKDIKNNFIVDIQEAKNLVDKIWKELGWDYDTLKFIEMVVEREEGKKSVPVIKIIKDKTGWDLKTCVSLYDHYARKYLKIS